MKISIFQMERIALYVVISIGIYSTHCLNMQQGQYCNDEYFMATCDPGEIIVMKNATYGRMKVGKCIPENLRIGCKVDVLLILNRLCSGKQTCSFFVPLELAHTSPCAKGLTAYLEALYTCIKVDNLTPKSCNGQAEHLGGRSIFHLSSDADEAKCTPSWHIQANPGQIIEVRLMDFTQASEAPISCPVLGHVVENVVRSNRTLCGSTGSRETLVYTSVGHEVEVTILPPATRGGSGKFALQYTAKGCTEKPLQPNVYYRRDGDSAEIGCSAVETKWRLQCVEGEWKGKLGNCTIAGNEGDTSSSFGGFLEFFKDVPESIVIAIVIGIAVLLSVFVLVCGFVYIAKHRNHKDTISETYAHGPRRTEDEFKMYGPETSQDDTIKCTPLMYHNTNDRRGVYPTMIDKRDMYPINDSSNDVCSCASYSSIPRLDDKQAANDEEVYLDPTDNAIDATKK